MKKKLLAILLCLCMVMSLAPAALAAGSAPFTDVAADAWYADEVQWVYDQSLMDGVGNGNFAPATTTTRGMLVTILWRLEGEPEPAAANPFTDVADGQWYTEAVIWAAENKIVEGYGANLFGPADDITREQLATILYRYAQYKEYDVSVGENTNILSYVDAFDISEWAIPAMQWACGAGLISGVTEDALAPQSAASRAQLAVVLYRLNENVIEPEEEEPVTPPAPPVIIPPTPDCTDTYESNGNGTHDVTCSDGTHTGTEFCSFVEGGDLCECGFDRSTAVAKILNESEDGYYYYATLAAALGAAEDGNTIQLSAGTYENISFTKATADNLTLVGGEGVTVGTVRLVQTTNYGAPSGLTLQGITFNAEGITGSDENSDETNAINDLSVIECTFTNGAVIHLNGDCAVDGLTVKDSVFEETDSTANPPEKTAILVQGSAKDVEIIGNSISNCEFNAIQLGEVNGTLTISGNTINGTGDRVLRFSTIKADADVSISGNTVTSEGDNGQMIKATTIEDGADFVLSGNKWNSATVNDETLVKTTTSGTVWSMPVAKNGTAYYATLDAAIAAGGEVTLLKSINNQGQALNIPQNANITLDLNGHTFTSMDGGAGNNWAIKVDRGATFTLKNSVGEGKVVASCYGIYVQPGATFNLESGTIQVSGNGTYDFGVTIWNSTFNMTGGKIEAQVGVCTSDYWATTGGETGLPVSNVSVSAGTINIVGDYYPEIIYSEGAYTAAITGGTFSGTFTDSLNEYIASGYVAIEDNGTWTVTAEQ